MTKDSGDGVRLISYIMLPYRRSFMCIGVTKTIKGNANIFNLWYSFFFVFVKRFATADAVSIIGAAAIYHQLFLRIICSRFFSISSFCPNSKVSRFINTR